MQRFTILLVSLLLLSSTAAALNTKVPAPVGVAVQLTDQMGPVFTNAEGYTLYSWRNDDRAYKSKCNDDRYERVLGRGQAVNYLPEPQNRPSCEQAWPPFRPDNKQAIGDRLGDWQVMARHDQSPQWAYKGKPVYLSSYDNGPGQLNGVGRFYDGRTTFLGRTPLFAPLGLPAGMSGRATEHGYVLSNAKGFTLYQRADGAGDCNAECEKDWRPFQAPVLLNAEKARPFGFVRRDDGTRQWSRDGRALYSYVEDRVAGEVNGDVFKDWQAVILYPAVQPPADITVQMSGNGEVYADSQGRTLYSFYCFDEAPDHLPCDTRGAPQMYRLSICGTPETCMATWQPVVASENAKPVGKTWSIVAIDPTGKQLFADEEATNALHVWAYNGRPVFTYAMDKQPGDIMGDKVSHLVDWGYWILKK